MTLQQPTYRRIRPEAFVTALPQPMDFSDAVSLFQKRQLTISLQDTIGHFMHIRMRTA